MTATHFFAPEAFGRALASRAGAGPLTLTDRAGDTVSLAPEESIAIEVVQPDQVRVGLPRSRFPTESDARAVIASRGGEVLSSRGLRQGGHGGPAPIRDRSPRRRHRRNAGCWTSAFRPLVARPPSTKSAISIDWSSCAMRERPSRPGSPSWATAKDGLVVRATGGERHLTTAQIAAVRTLAPVVIPPDAFLLVEGDRPREHAVSIFFALMLVLFGTVNVMGLVRNRAR